MKVEILTDQTTYIYYPHVKEMLLVNISGQSRVEPGLIAIPISFIMYINAYKQCISFFLFLFWLRVNQVIKLYVYVSSIKIEGKMLQHKTNILMS